MRARVGGPRDDEEMNPPTGCVTLHTWGAADRPLLDAFNTAEMTAHLGGPETAAQLEDRQARYLRLQDAGDARMFRIDVGDQSAGGIGYWAVDHHGRAAFEAGWSVLPAFQGRGVATAALRHVIARIRAEGRRDLLVAHPGADNPASAAVCRHTGFVETGSGSEPWRGGTLHFRVWELDLA